MKPTKVLSIRQREIVYNSKSVTFPILEGEELPDPSFYARVARLSSIIFMLPSCMAAGWILGHFVMDRFLPTYPWGTVGFTLLGAGAGFYQIIQILNADQRKKDD